MTEANRRRLEAAAEEIGGLDVEFQGDYSGRGMMGERTHALVCSPGEFITLVGLACHAMGRDGEDPDDLLSWAASCRHDSMGYQRVYY